MLVLEVESHPIKLKDATTFKSNMSQSEVAQVSFIIFLRELLVYWSLRLLVFYIFLTKYVKYFDEFLFKLIN